MTAVVTPTPADTLRFAVTFFQNHGASSKHEEFYSLPSLAARIRATTATEKRSLPWLKLARFGEQRTEKGSLRHDANMLAVSGIEADYDAGVMPVAEAVERLTKAGAMAIVYTSPSHTDAAPRWRVLVPLSEELPPERRDAMMGRLNGLFDGQFAPESWARSQSYFFGSVAGNPAHHVELIDGAPLDTLAELDRIWRGKPNTASSATGLGDGKCSGRVNAAELIEQIISGDAYHTAAVRLLGHWARQDVPYMDARTRLIEAMEQVAPTARDARWRSRRADIDRCLTDIYGKNAAAKDAAARQDGDPPPSVPEVGFLSRTRLPAPPLPLDAFGPWWASWIADTAAGANAPPDYVVLPLLSVASALIGNARWPRGWPGWFEPPVLWCASVGNPSSGKSPGAAPVIRDVLGLVEANMAGDYPAEMEAWKEAAKVSEAVARKWEKDVAKALEDGKEVPAKPREAIVPDKPVRPRVRISDTTVEALAPLLRGLPKGVLNVRDELAGWLLNLSRYNGGTDRPFWLESYVGGSYTVDRQKHPDPIHLPRLAVPAFGTIQPDRLHDALTGTDDGLAGRFLWAWPDPVPFRRPKVSTNAPAAAAALGRLVALSMIGGEDGEPKPDFISLTSEAADLLERFAQDMQAAEEGAYGLLRSSMGKARGQALRLALVLELLRWCACDGKPEPRQVSADAIEAAISLMGSYFLPMAARVLGDASVPAEEHNARTLAQWIIRTRPAVVNVSAIRDGARLPGLRESEPVKQACRFLTDARWLLPRGETGKAGRPRGDWMVNPLLWTIVP